MRPCWRLRNLLRRRSLLPAGAAQWESSSVLSGSKPRHQRAGLRPGPSPHCAACSPTGARSMGIVVCVLRGQAQHLPSRRFAPALCSFAPPVAHWRGLDGNRRLCFLGSCCRAQAAGASPRAFSPFAQPVRPLALARSESSSVFSGAKPQTPAQREVRPSPLLVCAARCPLARAWWESSSVFGPSRRPQPAGASPQAFSPFAQPVRPLARARRESSSVFSGAKPPASASGASSRALSLFAQAVRPLARARVWLLCGGLAVGGLWGWGLGVAGCAVAACFSVQLFL